MRIVIVGGVAAGMSAASQARRRNPKAEVIVLQRGGHISYSACGMPYNIGDPDRKIEDLVILDVDSARKERGIDVRTGHDAVSIDPAARMVAVRQIDGARGYEIAWDRLILTTGASAIRPNLPGLDLPGVFVVRELEDADAIKSYLRKTSVTKAVIVGAGYIGLEMADALHGLGVEVSVLEKGEQILPGFAPAIIDEAGHELLRNSISVRTGVDLRSIESMGADLAVNTDSGSVSGQLVIIAVGARPNVELAESSGIRLGITGAIAVDDGMRTSVPDIFAAGDCAEAHHLVLDRPVWIPLGTTANKQGKVAGANAAGANEVFGGIVGTAGFKLFDLEVARTGLGERDIASAGLTAVTAVSHHHTRARNYPGDKPITTVIYIESGSGRLLGAQMIGGESVAKRVDVFATALHAKMTVGQVESLDLSYAPPFAPVYDPILIAATVGLKELSRRTTATG
ncbi:MAG: FAD-dependent oxidoreductase [Burkholderiales bacterium]|nr:FAD-dependent oxidoreductase [Burkholderiales bacterium]